MIPSVGKQKILYKDHKDIKFESMDFYISLAQKIISKIAPTFFNGLSKEMLKNEDAISFVASSIMMGDWRWKNEESDKKYKSLYSYRNQCGIWAIKTYITKKYKSNNSKKKLDISCSINYTDENDTSLESVIQDNNQQEPISILIDQENKAILTQDIESIINISLLSEKQKEHIKLYYYENMTLDQIGKKYGVSREAIRQSIKSAIAKIREIVT